MDDTGLPIRVRVLGCGSSGGVPRVGGDWGACDPAEPRNRRTRCSILLTRGRTRVLIDTSPDLREQLLAAEVRHLTAVALTHAHADQLHGLDDLRALYLSGGQRRIPFFAAPEVLAEVSMRFDYCFREVLNYPPILAGLSLTDAVTIGEGGEAIRLEPFTVQHGAIEALGFRVGRFAYTPDVSDIPEESWPILHGLDAWLVDALRDRPHPSHAHLARTLEWLARAKPARGILTNMHVDLDYHLTAARCPANVAPAWDGMEFDISA